MTKEIVEGMDLCGVPALALAVHALALAAARRVEKTYADAMGYAAIATLLTVGGWAVAEVGLWNFRDVLAIGVLAWLSAASAALLALLVVPPVRWMWVNWKAAIEAHRREVRKFREREQAKKAMASAPPLPPPPPPPSRSELLAEAEAAYLEERRLIDLLLIPDAEKDAVKVRAERKYLDRVADLMGMS